MGLWVFVEREWRVRKARSSHSAQSPFSYKLMEKLRADKSPSKSAGGDAQKRLNSSRFSGNKKRFSTEVLVRITIG